MQPNIRYVGDDYWDFYDHFIPLTHLSCAELLQNCGFVIERHDPALPALHDEELAPAAPALVKLYLRVPPLWRVMGKQFLIVARKPAAV